MENKIQQERQNLLKEIDNCKDNTQKRKIFLGRLAQYDKTLKLVMEEIDEWQRVYKVCEHCFEELKKSLGGQK